MKLAQIEKIIDIYFEDEELNSSVNNFLERSGYSEKWLLYSDYCLDDHNKPNDVLSFALIPFLDENIYQALDKAIHTYQPKDIKKSKEVNEIFLKILKDFPIFSFSFILDDRELLFGDTGNERVKNVTSVLDEIKHNFEAWRKNAEEENEVVQYYEESIKKFKAQIHKVEQKKDTSLISDIILIALLGGVYASKILKRLPNLDIIGWFPDRDASNEGCDNIIVPIYNTILYNRIQNRYTRWAVTMPDTSKKPFYDNENRIVDYICGTIADYDFQNNKVSKDKFCTVLEDLLADNPNIRIYRIKSSKNPLQIGSITIEKKSKPDEDEEHGEKE